MLRVEVDIFSGRPNPVWIETDADKTRDFLNAIADSKGAIARPGAGFAGLGLREVRVSVITDDDPLPKGMPRDFALASTAAENFKDSAALARGLIETMPTRQNVQLLEHSLTPLTPKLRNLVMEQLDLFVRKPPREEAVKARRMRNPLITTTNDAKCVKCQYEISQFNPAFWNAPTVQPYNNCYNYGRNWRTNTFAQPGRAHGAQTNVMACGNVTTAAMADGLKKRCTCLPPSEYPRRLMALVIWPDVDYHWYRHQRGGFWGHKPGGTAARNTDNSSVIITNPETCNRGGYTNFCDYFYAGRSVVIN
jgi:hypothetical protein